MEKICRLTDSEKELINILGKMPRTTPKELLNYTKYKWVSTVVRKLDRLKEQDIIWGPYYQVDYGKLCKNSLHILVYIIEFSQSYETVISYLTMIEPKWIYPVLSSYKKLLHVGFISSNDKKMISIMNMLKKNNIITDYVVRTCTYKWITENPNFFGDYNPPLDNLLDSCVIPDMAYRHHDTNWNQCDIRILPYLQVGYKGAKLIEILRAERNLYSREWKYPQIKYSRRKMIKKGLIEIKYSISPFPRNKCAHFILFLKTEDIPLTKRILCNFAKKERVFKEYTLCEEWGMVTCQSHPVLLTDLMQKLDSVNEITEKELYQLRSYPGKYFFKQSFEDKYYDFDSQTLEYPYNIYKEKIKKKINTT
jgi:DNA-binding Lrp family transcriptional regulator